MNNMLFLIMFKHFAHEIANAVMALSLLLNINNLDNSPSLNQINRTIKNIQNEVRIMDKTNPIVESSLLELDQEFNILKLLYKHITDVYRIICDTLKIINLYKYIYGYKKNIEIPVFDVTQNSDEINKILCLTYIASNNYEFVYQINNNSILISKYDSCIFNKLTQIIPKYNREFNDNIHIRYILNGIIISCD